jgi:VWFA-related protein
VKSSRLLKCLLLAPVLTLSPVVACAGQESATPEISSTNMPFNLKVERNEVPVRVVVRDAQGRPVRDLTKDDFRILDEGQPQVITQFSTESAAAPPTPPAAQAAAPPSPSAVPKIADRFVALYFDDLVMDFEGIARARDAASKYIQSSLKPGDRVAIYTSSGRGNLDFTADRDKLLEALSQLSINNLHARAGPPCPPITDYEAYRIEDLNDSGTLQIVAARAIACMCPGNPQNCPDARSTAESAAQARWGQVEREVIGSLRGLEELVRRISVMPGQRSIVFVSPGFISESQLRKVSEITSRAVRAGVVINALDSRGLYTNDPDYQPANDPQTQLVLADFAGGTGGVFFHNNNDFDAGFRAAGGLPEYSYVLVFSPGTLKANGKYHHLSVELVGAAASRGLRVQARRGYFAPQTVPSSAQAEQEELMEAVYSRDEINNSRLRLQTRFFKPDPMQAQFTVVAHLEPQWLTFRKQSGRNADDVTFATAIFDNDGNLVAGFTKTLELRLRDATLEKLRTAGISVVNNFKVAPGSYQVREVVKDAGGFISSKNEPVEIP